MGAELVELIALSLCEVFLFAFPVLNSMQVSSLLSTHPLFRNQVTIRLVAACFITFQSCGYIVDTLIRFGPLTKSRLRYSYKHPHVIVQSSHLKLKKGNFKSSLIIK